MDEKICVSVVLPVWNPGPEIARCIRSLREQSLRKIELIFVDDLGTDGGMDLVRAAAAEDDRIRIITNPQNLGPGPSRNAGIEAARGEYLSFVDPDDYVGPDFLELLYRKASEEDLDIVKGRIVYEREDGTVAPHYEPNDAIMDGLKAGRPLYSLFTYGHQSAIYRKRMLTESGARYGTSRRAQDTTFLLKACAAAATFGVENSACYYFVERQGSAMHVYDRKSAGQWLLSFREQAEFLAEKLRDDPAAVRYTAAMFRSNLRFFIRHEGIDEFEEEQAAYREKLKEVLLGLPFLKELRARCFPACALLDYDIILPSTPGYLPWEKASSKAWCGIVKQWADVLSQHPERADKALTEFSWVLGAAKKALNEESGDPGTRELAASSAKELGKQMRRLPFPVRMKLALNPYRIGASMRLPKWLLTAIRRMPVLSGKQKQERKRD